MNVRLFLLFVSLLCAFVVVRGQYQHSKIEKSRVRLFNSMRCGYLDELNERGGIYDPSLVVYVYGGETSFQTVVSSAYRNDIPYRDLIEVSEDGEQFIVKEKKMYSRWFFFKSSYVLTPSGDVINTVE